MNGGERGSDDSFCGHASGCGGNDDNPGNPHLGDALMEVKHLPICLVCKKGIENPGYCFCRKCRNPCEVDTEDTPSPTIEVKSTCCQSDVDVNTRTTCSEACHEKLIQELEAEWGKNKVVVAPGGSKHLVPLRHIVEHGLQGHEVTCFPEAP